MTAGPPTPPKDYRLLSASDTLQERDITWDAMDCKWSAPMWKGHYLIGRSVGEFYGAARRRPK